MRKWVRNATTAALLMCMGLPALADDLVYTTSNVNLRTGPGMKYKKVGMTPAGTGLEYMGRVAADKSGVNWYQVRYYGEAVWISSDFAYLDPEVVKNSYSDDALLENDEDISAIPLATPQAVITAVPSFDDEATLTPTFGVPGMIELSGYYHTDLKGSAIALGLKDHSEDANGELTNMYYNDVLLIAGNEETEHFRVTGSGYTIFGVYVGMDIASAQAVLTAAGLKQTSGTMGLYFQHPGPDASEDVADGFDSGINAVTDGSGRVTEISWSTYTS